MDNKKKRWFPWQPKKGEDQEIQDLLKRTAERPDDPRLHQRLAELYLEKGKKGQAIEEFVRAAECHSEAGFYLRAIALYRRILRMEEESTEILLRLAELYLVNGLLGDALVQFKKVIQQYRKQGKTHEILSLLRRMVETDPENVEVRTKYIELLRGEGFAVQAFDELIRLYMEHREKDRQELLPEVEAQIRALHRELEDRFQRDGKARELAGLEQKMQVVFAAASCAPPAPVPEPEGQMDLEEVLEEEPSLGEGTPQSTADDPGLRVQEALLYAEQGLFDEAESVLESLLEAWPDHEEARRSLEAVRLQKGGAHESGDPRGVVQKLDALEEKQRRGGHAGAGEALGRPDGGARSPRAHYELGLAYRELGLTDLCIEEWNAALGDPSLAFDCHRGLGACYGEKGEMEKSIHHLQEAFNCSDVAQAAWLDVGYELAQALEREGRRDEALRLYRKIGEQDQGFRDIQERVKSLSR